MDLTNALTILGANKKQIAISLAQKNIKGKTKKFSGCPIARYLESLGFTNPCVGNQTISCFDDKRKRVKVNTQKPMSEFITDFDAGLFAELRRA
jgi:hypothetical protein